LIMARLGCFRLLISETEHGAGEWLRTKRWGVGLLTVTLDILHAAGTPANCLAKRICAFVSLQPPSAPRASTPQLSTAPRRPGPLVSPARRDVAPPAPPTSGQALSASVRREASHECLCSVLIHGVPPSPEAHLNRRAWPGRTPKRRPTRRLQRVLGHADARHAACAAPYLPPDRCVPTPGYTALRSIFAPTAALHRCRG